MDLKTAVFNAARDGKLRLLSKLLASKTREEVALLMSEKTNGATPLLMAARYGHLDMVEYLLDHCSASIEVGGSVNFDGETIEGAPPLWAASAAGHLKVVQCLLDHGASVNNTTLTNSTPLRAACFDGHLEIVKYLVEHKADLEVSNRHGHTCLMISCYKGHKEIAQYLLEKGADVNRKSVKVFLLTAGIESNQESLKCTVTSSDGPQTSLRKKQKTHLHVKFREGKVYKRKSEEGMTGIPSQNTQCVLGSFNLN